MALMCVVSRRCSKQRTVNTLSRLNDHFCNSRSIGQAARVSRSARSAHESHLLLQPKQFFETLGIKSLGDWKSVFQRYNASGSGQLSPQELQVLVRDVHGGSNIPLKGCQNHNDDVGYAVGILLQKYGSNEHGRWVNQKGFEALVNDLAEYVDPRARRLAVCVALSFGSFSMIFPMGPSLVQIFSLSGLQFGTLMTAFAVAKLCGNIPSTMLSERIGRTPVLVSGVMLIGLGIAGIGVANCYEHLLMLRFFVGLGIAGTFTSAGMYITDISHALNSARTRAPLTMGMSVGMLGGPALGGVLLENFGIQFTAFSVGTATLAAAALAAAVLPETLKVSSGKTPPGLADIMHSWLPMLNDHHFRTILSWGGCYHMAFWGAITLLPLVYVDLGLTPVVVGGISTYSSLITVASTPVVARAADRVGKLSLALPGAVVYGGGLLLVPNITSIYHLLPVLAVMQVGATMSSQAQMHAVDFAKAGDRAKVPGLWNSAADIGMLLSSFASAAIAQASTTGQALAFDGAGLILATGLIAGLTGLHRVR